MLVGAAKVCGISYAGSLLGGRIRSYVAELLLSRGSAAVYDIGSQFHRLPSQAHAAFSHGIASVAHHGPERLGANSSKCRLRPRCASLHSAGPPACNSPPRAEPGP